MPDPVCSRSGPCASVLFHLSRLSPSRLLCPPVATTDTRQDPPASPYADFPFGLCFYALRWTPDVTRESITVWAGWREGRMCQCLLSVHRLASPPSRESDVWGIRRGCLQSSLESRHLRLDPNPFRLRPGCVCVIESCSCFALPLLPLCFSFSFSVHWEGREGLLLRPFITLVELLQDRFSLSLLLCDSSDEMSYSPTRLA